MIQCLMSGIRPSIFAIFQTSLAKVLAISGLNSDVTDPLPYCPMSRIQLVWIGLIQNIIFLHSELDQLGLAMCHTRHRTWMSGVQSGQTSNITDINMGLYWTSRKTWLGYLIRYFCMNKAGFKVQKVYVTLSSRINWDRGKRVINSCFSRHLNLD